MDDENKQKEVEFLESLVKDQTVTRAIQKLNREPLKVSVYRHTSVIEALERESALIKDALTQIKENNDEAKLKQRLAEIESELDKVEKDTIDGVLTQLTYRDINDIKAAVTEALVHFKDYNFDLEVIMTRVIAEERYMTVFCALKTLSGQRYFKSLDEIALVEDSTIFALYDKWEKHFVLTDDELKN
jgi:hypothetical protein